MYVLKKWVLLHFASFVNSMTGRNSHHSFWNAEAKKRLGQLTDFLRMNWQVWIYRAYRLSSGKNVKWSCDDASSGARNIAKSRFRSNSKQNAFHNPWNKRVLNLESLFLVRTKMTILAPKIVNFPILARKSNFWTQNSGFGSLCIEVQLIRTTVWIFTLQTF